MHGEVLPHSCRSCVQFKVFCLLSHREWGGPSTGSQLSVPVRNSGEQIAFRHVPPCCCSDLDLLLDWANRAYRQPLVIVCDGQTMVCAVPIFFPLKIEEEPALIW